MPDNPALQPSLIVFRDYDGKRCEAGWFTEADAARAKADRSMPSLSTMERLSAALREFAFGLPAGRFGADGKLELGLVERTTIERLLALRSQERKASATEGQGGAGQPTPAQSAAAKATDPKASAKGEAAATTAPSGNGSKGADNGQEKVRPSPTTAEIVDTLWSKITVGSVVIAPAPDRTENGWWEAVVTEKRGQKLTLRWRDYPKQRPITRKLSEVALAHPKSGV